MDPGQDYLNEVAARQPAAAPSYIGLLLDRYAAPALGIATLLVLLAILATRERWLPPVLAALDRLQRALRTPAWPRDPER